ncbi:hypothetical protein Hanom_Chr12g01135181 [Helianthus anomalus]
MIVGGCIFVLSLGFAMDCMSKVAWAWKHDGPMIGTTLNGLIIPWAHRKYENCRWQMDFCS